MDPIELGLCSPPRIIVAGRPRDALGRDGAGFADALGRMMPVTNISASPSPAGMLRLMRGGADAVRVGKFEALHLLDARLTPAALVLRARFGLPVTLSLSTHDAPARRPSLALQFLRRIDHAFAADNEVASRVAKRAGGVPLSVMRPVAEAGIEPAQRALDRFTRMLRDITPGRLVVAVPWPADLEQLRWMRDAVVPLLHGKPVMLLLGAPGRREARLLTGAMGLQGTYRVHAGPLDAGVLAAAARCSDAFVVPGPARRLPDLDALLLTLTASGVPVVAGGGVRSGTVEHEHNAFQANAEDAMSLVTLLNNLLALPAVQRHYLGEEFAAHTLDRWSWERAVGAYASRFAALVGRPQIPVELRAA
jgi:hypothetical protein